MRRAAVATVFAAVLAASGVVGSAGLAAADSQSFTFVCTTASGVQTFTLTKPNDNSAIFTNGSTLVVSAIGSAVTGGTAQSNAVPCTVNGEGPFPFLIVRS